MIYPAPTINPVFPNSFSVVGEDTDIATACSSWTWLWRWVIRCYHHCFQFPVRMWLQSLEKYRKPVDAIWTFLPCYKVFVHWHIRHANTHSRFIFIFAIVEWQRQMWMILYLTVLISATLFACVFPFPPQYISIPYFNKDPSAVLINTLRMLNRTCNRQLPGPTLSNINSTLNFSSNFFKSLFIPIIFLPAIYSLPFQMLRHEIWGTSSTFNFLRCCHLPRKNSFLIYLHAGYNLTPPRTLYLL